MKSQIGKVPCSQRNSEKGSLFLKEKARYIMLIRKIASPEVNHFVAQEKSQKLNWEKELESEDLFLPYLWDRAITAQAWNIAQICWGSNNSRRNLYVDVSLAWEFEMGTIGGTRER